MMIVIVVLLLFHGYLSGVSSAGEEVLGCPKLPAVQDGKILAGRLYYGLASATPELSCNGAYTYHYAETKLPAFMSQGKQFPFPFNSVIVNPGCKLKFWRNFNYSGPSGEYGAGIYPNPSSKKPSIIACGHDGDGSCVGSVLWTCKQSFPSCIPSDKWETLTQIDNIADVATTFSYEKEVGTQFSQSMTESTSVSATVSAAVTAEFWGLFSSTLGISATTGYSWDSTTSQTRSTMETYTVEVVVPPKTTIQIQAVVGKCGGSEVHTQMFRVVDPNNKRVVEIADREGEIVRKLDLS